jgi:hypothetical protein
MQLQLIAVEPLTNIVESMYWYENKMLMVEWDGDSLYLSLSVILYFWANVSSLVCPLPSAWLRFLFIWKWTLPWGLGHIKENERKYDIPFYLLGIRFSDGLVRNKAFVLRFLINGLSFSNMQGDGWKRDLDYWGALIYLRGSLVKAKEI